MSPKGGDVANPKYYVPLNETTAPVDYEGGGHSPGTCTTCGGPPGKPATVSSPLIPIGFVRAPHYGEYISECANSFHPEPEPGIPFPSDGFEVENEDDWFWALIVGLLTLFAFAVGLVLGLIIAGA